MNGDLPSEVTQSVLRSFLVFAPDDLVHSIQIDGVAQWQSLVRDVADGLASVIQAASLPFQLTCRAVHQRRFDRFHSAERIRQLKFVSHGSELSPDQEQVAYDRASDNMREFLCRPEGTNFIRDAVVNELHRGLEDDGVKVAASELMRQSVVATWGVFETFATSFVAAWINADGRRAKALISLPELRNVLGKGGIEIDLIEASGFDLTNSMGSVLLQGKRLDGLSVLRAALNALLPTEGVREALGATMWELNQRRHLLVHRRGIVDREFSERTGDQTPVGSKLEVTAIDTERYLVVVRDAVREIANAANAAVEP